MVNLTLVDDKNCQIRTLHTLNELLIHMDVFVVI